LTAEYATVAALLGTVQQERRMTDLLERVALAPISWGICEVPGWGARLPTDRVLTEMSSLGLRATELGAPGFLPDDPGQLCELLGRYGMNLVGAFTPLQAHDPDRLATTLDAVRAQARRLSVAGATVLVSALVQDEQWSIPRALTAAQHRQLVRTLTLVDEICAEHGLRQVLHPHVQTLVETADDVHRILDSCDVSWCLDTGHLAIGGVDPVRFAQEAGARVGHVHLKDVRLDLAAPVLRREVTLMEATQTGLFTPLGQGDVDIAGVIVMLESAGYRGCYVIEQDTAITGSLPPEGEGPVTQVRSSLSYLTDVVAPRLPGRG
jgi:inosose dehydratase